MSEGRFSPPIVASYSGTPSANTTFAPLYVGDCPWVTAYGSVSEAGTVSVVYSNDGSNWYLSENSQTIGAGGGDFGIDFRAGAGWVGLQFSGTGATVSAIVSAKG